jgi:hypothetical protein
MRKMKQIFDSWRENNKATVYYLNQLFRIDKKVDDLRKIRAITTLQHYSWSKHARENEAKAHSAGDIASCL